MSLIEIGKKAPSFQLFDQHGKGHNLKHYAGRPLVLFFYPKDDSVDCTKQACQARDLHADFAKLHASVLGISPDGQDSHAAFASKHRLGLPLLVDAPNGRGEPRMCADYGVWVEKSMYGRKYMGVVRTTYLIAPDGKVARRWDRVSVTGHLKEVLGAVKELEGTKSSARPAKRNAAAKRGRTKQSGSKFTPVRSMRKAAKPKATRKRVAR